MIKMDKVGEFKLIEVLPRESREDIFKIHEFHIFEIGKNVKMFRRNLGKGFLIVEKDKYKIKTYMSNRIIEEYIELEKPVFKIPKSKFEYKGEIPENMINGLLYILDYNINSRVWSTLSERDLKVYLDNEEAYKIRLENIAKQYIIISDD